MPKRSDLRSVLIIGSGPIQIGQACEFDYSGNQAVRALKEEGYRVILVNPNPATIMTTPGLADRIYVDPLEPEYLDAIIRAERPDALLATMGGQTALNAAVELGREGILERHGVEVIGASLSSIELAEDRGRFKELMGTIGLDSPRSELVHSMEEARAFADSAGFPLIVRPSYTLGGRGGGIVESEAEFAPRVQQALRESPVHSCLIEESLLGWREFELEVVRDPADNAVVVCSIENVDPMGVHTGDSITVAPTQTLSDREYQVMRSAGIEVLRAVGVDCGGSNVQFAINPAGTRMVVIEMNPRVSRSSALASKATGFPIARSAAKLAVGYTLDEVINEITGRTSASFEPALDYVAVKVPRFELEKFPRGHRELGTQMRSVGESLAIGRSFPEALNKALRASESGLEGLEALDVSPSQLATMIDTRHPRRILALYTALLQRGAGAIEELAERSGYAPWFLSEMAGIAETERELSAGIPSPTLLRRAKRLGLTDSRIAELSATDVQSVAAMRKDSGLSPAYHMVDTCAGEFAAATPYFYGTWCEVNEANPDPRKSVVILASGPNRIGQGLEFDTCCTLASMAYRRQGIRTVIINSNPETVSTDFNVSDRLYLEPLSVDDVWAVMEGEGITEVVTQLGGQTPLNMAAELEVRGASIMGTSVAAIEEAEDRRRFSDLIRRTGARQPENRTAGSISDIASAAAEIGYPVLVRPSFVLGGRSMLIAYGEEDLRGFLADPSVPVSESRPVLIDQFLEDAFEYDVDAVSDGRNVYIAGIMEHIEAAGIHSGDSACVFPAYIDPPGIHQKIVDTTVLLARELGVRGLLNIQFAARAGELYVIEVNPRASRTVPFISKASGVDLVDAAVRVWLGEDLQDQGLVGPDGVAEGRSIVGWAVKEAMFSFDRFPEVDLRLGPEMRSTGEAIGIGDSFGEAFAKASSAVGTRLPRSGRVFISVNDADKPNVVPIARELAALGFSVIATRGTADFLFRNGIFPELALRIHEGHPNILDHMDAGRIDLLVNTPMGRSTQTDDERILLATLQRGIPYVTTLSAARAAIEGIRYLQAGEARVKPLPPGSFAPVELNQGSGLTAVEGESTVPAEDGAKQRI